MQIIDFAEKIIRQYYMYRSQKIDILSGKWDTTSKSKTMIIKYKFDDRRECSFYISETIFKDHMARLVEEKKINPLTKREIHYIWEEKGWSAKQTAAALKIWKALL